jgi:type I restriction enzyme S subunit
LLNGIAFKPDDWEDRGLPIIRIQNLNGSKEYNYYSKLVLEDFIIRPGTLLFSWSGNRGTSFGPYLWNGPVGVLNQHIFKVMVKQGIKINWFYYALDKIRQLAENQAHGGSGLVHVRKEDLYKYPLAKPDEMEQQRIAIALVSYERKIVIEEEYLSKLRLLKKGLMHDLLTGKVRVNIKVEENEHEDRHHS